MSIDSKTWKLLSYIVNAIYKAAVDDYSDFAQDYSYLETHNSFGLMKANFINNRLGECVDKANASMHSFKRYSWRGRIIVDRKAKQTFSVFTHANLKTVFGKKSRRTPHYLQTVLVMQNEKCYNPHQQLTFMDTSPFDHKTFENDYRDIMLSNANEFKEYTHYVIAYTISKDELFNAELILFDSHFDVIEITSLNSLLAPDYGKLTDTSVVTSISKEKSARNLVALKHGIKLNLVEMDKDE